MIANATGGTWTDLNKATSAGVGTSQLALNITAQMNSISETGQIVQRMLPLFDTPPIQPA